MVRSITLLALAGAAFSLPVAPPSLGGLTQVVPNLVGSNPLLGGGAKVNGVGHSLRDVATVVAPVEALVNGAVSAVVPVAANVAANVGQVDVAYSNIADNIANGNNINVLNKMKRDDLADVEATLYAVINAFVKLLVNAGVDVQAVVGKITLQNDQILTNILNNNNIQVGRRGPVAFVLADVEAAVSVLAKVLANIGVPVQASLLKIGISYDEIANNVLNYNDVKILAARDVADVTAVVDAIVNALVDACASVGVDIFAEIATIDIVYSTILTDILNGNNVTILRRDPVASVVADLVAIITVLVDALVNAQVNIAATLLQIGIDCTSILTNVLNGNTINILRRGSVLDAVVPVFAFVEALIAACLNVDAAVAANILQVAIKNSNIATDILNNNAISIL